MQKGYFTKSSSGQVIVMVIVFSTIATVMMGALVGWAGVNINASRNAVYSEQAIQLAEAGVDYYRWHLAHAPQDFTDGTTTPSPYVHNVLDKDGNVSGQFSLVITAPPVGSTKVKIESRGIPAGNPSITRRIAVQLAIPSLAKYAVVANDDMRFGDGTEIFGPVQSNQGIRFDGLAHNLVTSAVATYTDPDSDACTGTSFGVHTCLSPADPAPPATVPTRSDVFQAGRQFPVPAIDFNGLTTNLAQIKSNAQSAGKYFAPSGAQGYHIILKTNDTFDIYKVTAQTTPGSSCTNVAGATGWGTWSVRTETFLANYAIPANGLVFVEDNVWVEGTINSARITIASGKFPYNAATTPNIVVNNDLSYTNFDGADAIALISQGNITVGMVSDTNLVIDGALVAQNGRVGRYYYPGGGGSSCSPYDTRTAVTLFGMIATDLRYGFAYTDGNGYDTRNITYDANLLYAPPPSFPLTSSQYQILSWQEEK
jgi:hypothetical protein